MENLTYNQFRKKVLYEMGFGINLQSCSGGVLTQVENDDGEVLVGIGTEVYVLEVGNAFYRLDESEQRKLYEVATAYSATPSDKRFEQKKYRYRLPMVHGDCGYINLGNNDKLIIGASKEVGEWRTSFTKSEIENLSFKKQKLFEIAVQEKVEAENVGVDVSDNNFYVYGDVFLKTASNDIEPDYVYINPTVYELKKDYLVVVNEDGSQLELLDTSSGNWLSKGITHDTELITHIENVLEVMK